MNRTVNVMAGLLAAEFVAEADPDRWTRVVERGGIKPD
jgi:hypothetical protein